MIRTLIAASLVFGTASLCAAEPDGMAAQADDRATIQAQAVSLFEAGRWQEFESAALEHSRPAALSADGVPLSFHYWASFDTWMQFADRRDADTVHASMADYRKSMPQSALAIIAEATLMHSDAWAIRGSGYARTVSPRQWEQFRKINREAWKLLQDTKAQTAQFPYWYLEGIAVGADAEIPDAQLRELLSEGLRKFPGNFSLYFGYLSRFSSRWGGDYDSMDQFITNAAAAAPTGQQDVFYARLYWSMHQHEDQDPDFFVNSLVSWPRMLRGLEQVMKQFPDSAWNRANLVMFACMNRDAKTYTAWRSNVDQASFMEAAPEDFTLEECDRQMLRIA